MGVQQVLLSYGGESIAYIIDVIGQAATVAYGLRKLRAAYSGAALRARRVSDNAEQDIGFDGEDLDWADAISFMGGSSLTVVTWYDQSSNGKNITQATTANQPVLDTTNFQITFDGSNDYLSVTSVDLTATNKLSMFLLSKSSVIPAGGTSDIQIAFSEPSGSAEYFRVYQSSADTLEILHETNSTGGNSDSYAGYAYGFYRMLSAVIDRSLAGAAQTKGRINRVNLLDGATGSPNANFTNSTLTVGSPITPTANFYFNGSMKEYILFPVALSDDARNSGELNIQNYHNAGFDFNATDFIAQATISDSTQKSAINQLVLDVKDISTGVFWRDKLKALYPYVGGTSTTHKWNLKDPRDLDAAFRGVFNGGGTHDANGYTPNGTDGYMDTKLNGSTQGMNNNHHSAVYIRGTGTIGTVDIGAYNDGAQFWCIKARNSSTHSFIGTYSFSGANDTIVPANSSTPGFYLETRRAAADAESYKDGSSTGTTGDAAQDIPSRNVWVGALGQATTPQYSNNNYTAASLGKGMTDAEVSAYFTAFQTFNGTLGR
jgi:hypothetical protein